MNSRSPYIIGGMPPMTPADSRSQTMRSDQDLSSRAIVPLGRQPTYGSPLYVQEPEAMLAAQGVQQQPQNTWHNQAYNMSPRRSHQEAISSQYNHQSYQNYIEPTRAFASPPPQTQQPLRSVSVDEPGAPEKHRRVSEYTGHNYGTTIIEGKAVVHQGDLYDGDLPRTMNKHNYGYTRATATARLRQGDASARALRADGFWDGRAPRERTYSGNHYPMYPGR